MRDSRRFSFATAAMHYKMLNGAVIEKPGAHIERGPVKLLAKLFKGHSARFSHEHLQIQREACMASRVILVFTAARPKPCAP